MKTDSRDKKKYPILAKTGSILLVVGRILLGCVFVFSGFVKAIDPLGSTYKFDEYFRAFGGVFESLTHISFPLAILLSTLEMAMGLSLILKIHVRITSVVALLFMFVMTSITFYSALKNPVSDCGCFGDALILSNWATFYKNLILITLVLLMIIYQGRIHSNFTPVTQNITVIALFAYGISLSVICYRHLPLIDFLPYKIGVNIPSAMAVPENAVRDKYVTTFIYAKNGIQKEFTLENYPKGDTSWKFVDQKTLMVSSGFKPPIHDFTIVDAQFEDITEKVLYDTDSTYLLIMYDLNLASTKGAKKAEVLYQKALKLGTKFYALTASSDGDVQAFKEKTGVTYPFCKTDPTTLKTIIRANPGVILIKNGTIIDKLNWRDFKSEKLSNY